MILIGYLIYRKVLINILLNKQMKIKYTKKVTKIIKTQHLNDSKHVISIY
jgi:hypothetical protein